MNAITREEKIMSGENLTPITRKEMFLAKAAGMDVETPEPITREEIFLSKIQGGSGGDGGTGIIEPLDVTENGVYTPPDGVDGYSPVNVLVSSPAERVKITDAAYLFYGDARLDLIDKVDISECENFDNAFGKCSLKQIPKLDTSNGTNFKNMFYSCKNLTQIPALDTSKGTNFNQMFYDCYKLTQIPELDTSNGTNFGYMFNACTDLTQIPELDTSNGTSFGYMFAYCSNLTRIPRLDVNKGTSFSSTFNSCSKLTDLYLYNIRKSIQIGNGTSWGHLLTVDSLVHTIKELCTVTSTQTLTMGNANLEKIADLYCKIIDDTNEKKPMELCESTDEGAMTLIDYAAEKGWTIA